MSSAIVSPSAAKPASSLVPAGAPSSPRRSRASSTIERPSGVSSWIDDTSAARTASTSVTPGAGGDRRGEPVAVGDRAGLVEQDHVDVARRLDRPAAHRQHVEPGDAVHAGDADRRQQAADRRRDEADEQRDEGDRVDGRARRTARTAGGSRSPCRKTIVRPGEQDRQGDLVRRPLALGALDEGDHPVEERLARVGRDADRRAGRWSSVVPPVTELRMSVPGSLRTGADSPVMAASLT